MAGGALISLGADTALAQARTELIDRQDLMAAYANAGVMGGMAVYQPVANQLTLVNTARTEQRFIPASTFKLCSSLIALETGVVKDVDEAIRYGGMPQPNKAWERDMSMRDAMPISNVAIYQELARRIGLERFKAWLGKLDYGNQQTGEIVDRFWLDGPLRTSAVDQSRFAARLAEAKLPMSQRSQAMVRDICRLENSGQRILYGKTGWSGRKDGIGWLTGWIEGGSSLTSFSINIDMPDIADAPKRLTIAKAVLSSLGLY